MSPTHIVNSNPDVCVVAWEITDRCNFQCWYCPEVLHAGTASWPDTDVALRYFQFLQEHHSGVYIDMLGGEPTLWPGLPEFVENLPEGIDCEITTNGSRTLRWWERVGPRLGRVTISHHFASASDEHLFDVVKFLAPLVHLNVLILLDPAFIDRVIPLQEKLRDMDVTYETKPIFPKFGKVMIDYSEDVRKLLMSSHTSARKYRLDCKPKEIWINGQKTKARDLIINHQNKFQGWSCRAGSQRLHIDIRGDVWAGSCRVKKIGHMSELPLLNDPVICTNVACTCVDDLRAEKWSNT